MTVYKGTAHHTGSGEIKTGEHFGARCRLYVDLQGSVRKDGFSYQREDFFQMHQSVKGCRVGPPMMFKFSNGRLTTNNWHERFKRNVHINEVIGKWIDVKLEVNFTESHYNLYFNDTKILDKAFFIVRSCGEPHFKFGIYRPGNERATGKRISILDSRQNQSLVEDRRNK